jgi:hypothetical protein
MSSHDSQAPRPYQHPSSREKYMKAECLTRKQLYNGITNCNSRHVACRHFAGDVLGFNVKVALSGLKRKGYPVDDTPTRFVGFYPISFHEYIRIKLPVL